MRACSTRRAVRSVQFEREAINAWYKINILLKVVLTLIHQISLSNVVFFYMFLLSLSVPSYCPICGPVFGGKGVRFTTSEDVYPEKGMLPLSFRT